MLAIHLRKQGEIMAYKVKLTKQAEDDYRAIVAYLIDTFESQQAARHFLNELENVITHLGEIPLAYSSVEEPRLRAMGYRKVPLMNYVLIFRIKDEQVYVIHIFHQQQDYAKLI